MHIKKTLCTSCFGSGKTQKWVSSEPVKDGICILRSEEDLCAQCYGKGHVEYPVFTVEEAIKIAEHLGLEIIRED